MPLRVYTPKRKKIPLLIIMEIIIGPGLGYLLKLNVYGEVFNRGCRFVRYGGLYYYIQVTANKKEQGCYVYKKHLKGKPLP